MPHPAPDQPRTGPELPRRAAPPSEPPNPGPSAPDDTPPKPSVKGALFRALVDAGADPLVAYTADEQAESMVSESVAVQVQPILADIRHQFAERDRKLDALAEAGAERDRKLDAIVAEIRGLKEVIAVRVDAQDREMRLIWGALGVLLTVLTVVFGFLFAG